MRDWKLWLVLVGWIGGWSLLTWGIAELTTLWLVPISAGILLVGLGGFRPLYRLIFFGLVGFLREANRRED